MEQVAQGVTTWTWKLPNGLQIELGVHDLEQADLAVCSTDKDGNDGALNVDVLAAELFRGLHEHNAPFDRDDEALAAALRRHADGKDSASPERTDWEQLLRDVEALHGLDVTVGQWREAPRLLARFSLVTGHESHLWRAPVAAS
jgi:hypothetical protein